MLSMNFYKSLKIISKFLMPHSLTHSLTLCTSAKLCYTKATNSKNNFFVKKRQGPKSTSSRATKRANIKIWPRNFCDLVLLGNKEFKHCYSTANHNAYVTQQSYVISLNSKFKKKILSAIMQPQHSIGILYVYCF